MSILDIGKFVANQPHIPLTKERRALCMLFRETYLTYGPASYNSGEREPSCPYNNRMLHDRILRECPRKFGLPAHLWTVEDAHQLTCCANWPWNLIDNDSTITGVGHPKRNGLQTFSTVFAFGGEFGSVCLPSSLQPCRRLRIGKCPFRTRNADQS